MSKILITGGAGYIGSHTAIELLNDGRFEVISIDNFYTSSPEALERVEQITGKKLKNYRIDICDWQLLESIFQENTDIVGIIHFAAFKAVGESVSNPLKYYHNNNGSLVNILRACAQFNIPNLVFSSSCTVYGNIEKLPVSEDTPTQNAVSPYGTTKLMGEKMIQDFALAHQTKCILLRYFNPVGAHISGKIGETPVGKPNNLVPMITQTAVGLQEKLTVFGSNYPTKDGTCVRDYIHVSDIANGHLKAFDYLFANKNESNCEVFNLGTGEGVSVKEAIDAFEKVSGVKLAYELGEARAGDVVAIYSDCTKAKNKLGWEAKYKIEQMMDSAWKWEQNLYAQKHQKEAR